MDLIRKKRPVDVATAIPAIPAIPKPQTGRTVAKIATIAVANQKKGKPDISIAATTSGRWRVHFIDREPEESCYWPAVTAEQVLNLIAGAVRVESLKDGESSGLSEPDQSGNWSESEVVLVKQRIELFVLRGVRLADADVLACCLVDRDRMGDDRRSCAECYSMSHGRCRRGLEPLGSGGVEALHRCNRFSQIKDG